MSAAPTAPLPRDIWMFWSQGEDQAPPVVQHCIRSWRRLNPGWRVRVLQASDVGEYVDLARVLGPNAAAPQLAMLSDVLRIHLLAERGGVWADATCWCRQPLDDWIDAEVAANGLFAFRAPHRDRPVSSWFLAAAPGDPLATRWSALVRDYWSGRRMDIDVPGRRVPGVRGMIGRVLAAALIRMDHRWPGFQPVFRTMERLRLSPYFWFHYLFARLLRDDPEARQRWYAGQGASAEGPQRLFQHGLHRAPTSEILRELQEGGHPLHKLTWKLPERRERGALLDHILALEP